MSENTNSGELPQDQKRRRTFIGIVLVISLMCFGADLWLISLESDIKKSSPASEWINRITVVRSILENLTAGAIAALLLAFSYRWVTKWIDPSDRVVEIPATQITNRLNRNAKDTINYTFIGNTATFVTTSALATLCASARENSRARSVTLYIIDPTDTKTVDTYLSYSNRTLTQRIKVSDQWIGAWTLPQVTLKHQTNPEVTGKIFSAIYLTSYAIANQQIVGRIFLRKAFTPFRVDISDNEAVMTQENPIESAVSFSSRGHFYSWYEKECDALQPQCLELDLMAVRDQLMSILIHPSGSKPDIRIALEKLLLIFPYLAPLATYTQALDAAVLRISKRTHAYNL